MGKVGKPLGTKAYGHIPHLPGSRMTPGDHHCTEGHRRICTEKKRDRHDMVWATEKVDGSNVAIARIDGVLYPLTRSGYVANTSPFVQHHHFFNWVFGHQNRWLEMLEDGERLCGEWLAQAHGTRYRLPHEPFVAFDIMRGQERALRCELNYRAYWFEVPLPRALNEDAMPVPVAKVLELISTSGHGAIDPVEGAVWRVERKGQVDFLAKWVRPDKKDGAYLPEVSGGEPVWNWLPGSSHGIGENFPRRSSHPISRSIL